MADTSPVIGIDLGTTNTVVATYRDGGPVVIPNRSGGNLTPSVVAISKNGKVLIGAIAKRQSITNPKDTVHAAKRLIGRKFNSDQTQRAKTTMSFELVPGEHDDIRISLAGKMYSVPEISAMVLSEVKADAETYFGVPVTRTVITVPAYFNDGQRQATKDAGRIAGLDVLRIINEPTAASLAYGVGKNFKGLMAVFDLGGGTFDISVLDVRDGVFEVKATGGDTFLGGEDFDGRIIDWLASEFESAHSVNLKTDLMALQRLRDAAERAKIELSSAVETQINLPFICTQGPQSSALHLQKSFTREQFETLCADLIDRTIEISASVLAEAGVPVEALSAMVLVGGMTRMPKVQSSVRNLFKRDPSKGAHPDEVVALGAAVHSNVLTSEDSDIVLLDVTPQSLGVAVAGGYVRRLITKNSTVPTSATEVFSTSRDNQTTVKIMVLQGESEVAHRNELLGEFILTGLREAHRGEVEVEVTFDINSEGIVSVSALDKETGQQQSIKVAASSGLTAEELEKILEDQADILLLARADEETRRKAGEVREALSELAGLLVALEKADHRAIAAPLNAARGAADSARKALERGDLATLTNEGDKLGKAVAILKTLASRANL